LSESVFVETMLNIFLGSFDFPLISFDTLILEEFHHNCYWWLVWL